MSVAAAGRAAGSGALLAWALKGFGSDAPEPPARHAFICRCPARNLLRAPSPACPGSQVAARVGEVRQSLAERDDSAKSSLARQVGGAGRGTARCSMPAAAAGQRLGRWALRHATTPLRCDCSKTLPPTVPVQLPRLPAHLPSLLAACPLLQEELVRQRGELQNEQRDLFQREAELGMWVLGCCHVFFCCWFAAPGGGRGAVCVGRGSIAVPFLELHA